MPTLDELKALADQDMAFRELQVLADKPPKFSEMPLGRRAIARLSGEGDDPLALERAGSIAGMSIMGATAGARTPMLPGPAGAVVNPITGALAGGAAGAVAGVFAPETGLEIAEKLGLVPEGTRAKKGLSFEELKAVAEAEALLDIYIGGAFQAGAQLARQGVRAAAGIGRAETEMASKSSQAGITLPAFMAGGGGPARFFSTVFGRFPIVSTPLRREGQKAIEATERTIRDLPTRIAPLFSETDIGRHIYDNATTLSKKISAEFDHKYTDLFDEADRLGVRVTPRNTLAKADEILEKIARETPPSLTGEPTPPKVTAAVKSFIEKEILSLRVRDPAVTATARMSLRQLDGLMSKADQELAALEPGQKRFAVALISQLKTAMQADAVTNVSGPGAADIGKRLRALDDEFSNTMSTLFETATAKRFGTVRRQGLRGIAIDETTRTPIDQLARTVVDLRSPQAIDELSRLVTPDTMKEIASRAVKDIFDSAQVRTADGNLLFRPAEAAKRLGLAMDVGPKGKGIQFIEEEKGKLEAVEKLLRHSGLSVGDLKVVLNAAERIASTPLPDVSTFIARRATLGGAKAIRSALPGLAAGSSVLEGLVGLVMFAGGGRAVSRMLTDPLAAQHFKAVIGKTARRADKKASAGRALKGVLEGMVADGEIESQDAAVVFRDSLDYLRSLAE